MSARPEVFADEEAIETNGLLNGLVCASVHVRKYSLTKKRLRLAHRPSTHTRGDCVRKYSLTKKRLRLADARPVGLSDKRPEVFADEEAIETLQPATRYGSCAAPSGSIR